MTDDYPTRLRAAAVEALEEVRIYARQHALPLTVGNARALPSMRDYMTLAEPEKILALLDRLTTAEVDRDGQAALADSLALRLAVAEHERDAARVALAQYADHDSWWIEDGWEPDSPHHLWTRTEGDGWEIAEAALEDKA